MVTAQVGRIVSLWRIEQPAAGLAEHNLIVVLRASVHSNLSLAINGFNVDFGAEDGLQEGNLGLAHNVLSITLHSLMLFHLDRNQEVDRGTLNAVRAVAEVLQADLLSINQALR